MRVAIAQINTTAGDLAGNAAAVRDACVRAGAVDLVVAPELAIAGYPPRDLLLRPGFLRATYATTEALARDLKDGPAVIVGTVWPNPDEDGPGIVNAAVLLRGGLVEAVYAKRLLPTYDVFDERRYFAPGERPCVVEIAGQRVGLLVCEDLWGQDPVYGRRRYEIDPPGDLMAAGIDLAVGISASPYHGGKDDHRRDLFADEAKRMGVPLITVNQVGGNDDVLFDGRSRVFDGQGRTRLRLAAFSDDLQVVDLSNLPPVVEAPVDLPDAEETRQALVMGVRDYCRKTGFTTALLGLSGGVDSALTACIAADALGPENVLCVGMPSRFTADMSRTDAKDLTENLGARWSEIPIGGAYDAFLTSLTPHFEGKPFDVTEENIQARIRGAFLMALSNKHGHLLLTTGNKSEMAVGYCTLYGDMNGGLAVLADVYKTHVYEVATLYRTQGVMPGRIIDRPPSAELRPDQKDSDSLPPYDVLDRILKRRIEQGLSPQTIVAGGEDPAIVDRICRLVERNEYKRRQMPPGLKVTPVAFGVGWRMPIASITDLSNEL